MAGVQIAILFLFYFLVYSSADYETDLSFIRICNQTSPIPLRDLNQFLISKQVSKESTSNFKCFLHCLFAKFKWMDDEGGFLLHEMKEVLQNTEVDVATLEYVLYSCTAIRSIDKCERAFEFVQCFWRRTSDVPDEQEKIMYSKSNRKSFFI